MSNHVDELNQNVYYSNTLINIEQQIEVLQTRGLIVNDKEELYKFLTKVYFHRFLSYAVPFTEAPEYHKFKANISFETIRNVYFFDKKLRELLLNYIETIEISIRTSFVNLAHKYDPHFYLEKKLFKNYREFNDSVAQIHTQLKHMRELFVEEYFTKYRLPKFPPIWIVIEFWSIGQLSKWFKNLRNNDDKQAIANKFQLDFDSLSIFLQNLSLIRNYCAHHNYIWNRKFIPLNKIPAYPEFLGKLFVANGRKIYNTVIMITFLLRKLNNAHGFVDKLLTLITTYQIDTAHMGFPQEFIANLQLITET